MKINKVLMKKKSLRLRRKKHVRKKIFGSETVPRLSVFKSIKNIYIQAINDYTGKTILSLNSSSKDIKIKKVDYKKCDLPFIIGKSFGKSLFEKGITKACFDRNGYKYSGRVAKLVEGIKISGVHL